MDHYGKKEGRLSQPKPTYESEILIIIIYVALTKVKM
jgi:hypothetical protein